MSVRKNLIQLIITVLCFTGCKKDETKPSVFESKILGNWLVIDINNQPSNTEWGLFYVFSTKLYADRSFKVNLGTGVDSNSFRTGKWILNEEINSITFYSAVDELGTIERDTTEFNISIDSSDRLILKNASGTIMHKRLNN
jgi:hypothetical protein